jgi:hypothetical protein
VKDGPKALLLRAHSVDSLASLFRLGRGKHLPLSGQSRHKGVAESFGQIADLWTARITACLAVGRYRKMTRDDEVQVEWASLQGEVDTLFREPAFPSSVGPLLGSVSLDITSSSSHHSSQ